MKLKQPGQINVWIWLCMSCGKSIMAPKISRDCRAHCPICSSENIAPKNVLIWMAGQPQGLRDMVNFLRYERRG